MTDSNRRTLINILLTSALLLLAAVMLRETLPGYYQVLFIVGICCGFYFSWLNLDKEKPIRKFALATGTLGVFAWIIFSVINSSFLYQEVLLICIKGILVLEIILSFNVNLLLLMQALSIPLYMSLAFFVRGGNTSITAILFYNIICWLIILKIQFYNLFNTPIVKTNFRRNYAVIAIIIIFVFSSLFGWILFSNFRLSQMAKGGIFATEGIGSKDNSSALEDYYDLQDKLLNRMTEFISEPGSTEDKYKIIALLNYLIKDSSTIQEVQGAELGLISYIRTAGPGLEKGTEEIIVILKAYVDKKIQYNLVKIESSVHSNFRNNPADIKSLVITSSVINKIRYSDSPPQINQYAKQLQELADNSWSGSLAKEERKDLINQLAQWKAYELSRKGDSASSGNVIETQGTGSAGSHPLQTSPAQVSASIAKPQKEQREDYQQELDNKINPADLKAGIHWQGPKRISLIAVYLVFTGAMIWFAGLYFLTEAKKSKLIFSLYKDPGGFILDLYDNIKAVFAIFDMACQEAMPPLTYAKIVEDRYSIKDNLFIRFTAKFEEAKYSKHILQFEDARLALNDYNNILKSLFINYGKFSLFFRFCLALMHRKPLSIQRGNRLLIQN